MLILEDDVRGAKLAAKVLEGSGVRLQFEVTDSAEVFRANLEKSEYDVILADFNLRNWTALDALEILKQSGKDIPLIVVTGSLGDESAVECIKQGAADFVLKNRPARLPAAVQRALEDKRLRTEMKRAEDALILEKYLLHTLADNVPDMIYFKDRASRFTRINKALAKMFGLSDPAQAVGKTDFDFFAAEHAQKAYNDEQEIIRTGQPIVGTEEREIWPDGHVTWVSATKMPLRDAQGNITGNFGVSRDITARKQTELDLRRMNRALHTLSNCNEILVRAQSESELLESVCQSLVDVGGYRMAWVGLAEQDEAKTVRPVAHAGFEEGYLTRNLVTWGDDDRGLGPTGSAIRSGQPVINRNTQASAMRADWREEALKCGYASSMALPLRAGSRVLGALALYAVEADAFDQEDVRLLSDLADDVGYGIDTIRARAEGKLTEAENSRLAVIVSSSDDAIFSATREGLIVTWNAGAERMYGYAAEEITGKHFFVLIPEERRAELAGVEERLLRGDALVHFEQEDMRKDGSRLQVSLTLSPIKDAAGVVTGASVTARDITEQKRAEESLRESEERFRATFENAGIGMALVDMQGRPFRSNPILRQMLGYSEEELSRMAFTEFTHPDDRELDWGLYSELIAGKYEKYEMEKRFLKKGGGVLWGLLTVSLIKGSDGRPVCAVGMVQDITERKRAEAELRESEAGLAAAQRIAHIGSWYWDLQTDTARWSDETFRIFGLTPGQLEDHRRVFLELIHPEDRMAVDRALTDALRGTRDYDLDYRIRLADGTEKVIHGQGEVLKDEAGKPIGMRGINHDITESKRAEAEHVRLVTAIAQSAESVVITDTRGTIEYVNPSFTRITGYSRGEAVGQNPRILKSGKHDPAFYQQLWETILKGQPWQGELVNRRKDGSLYTEQMNIAAVRGEIGEITHFIATKQDVTERKILEEQVRQATKMEAVGRLAGGVAHDFNNLLTVINGYTELLMDKFASDSQVTVQLQEIVQAGGRAATLTRQLLAFSRSQVLAPQVLDLNAVVTNLGKMLKRMIGEDIELSTVLDPALGRVKADPGQIEQVIMNLVVNARDAMPQGGHLTLETSNVELDEIYARNHVTVKAGPHVMLAVADTGVGMLPETQAHIFEPFFTTKEQGKGTGLGLATVYGIVKQSGGSIWAYSEPGQGSVFKIYLPTVSEGPVAEPTKMEPDSSGGTETILVIEDEVGVRSLINLALESSGYTVLEADSAESALEICAKYEGPIHLLLTDVVMPQMSGPRVAEQVAAVRPDIKVLYMSGYTGDSVVRHGVLTQEMPFIQKPFSPIALRNKIREVLGGT